MSPSPLTDLVVQLPFLLFSFYPDDLIIVSVVLSSQYQPDKVLRQTHVHRVLCTTQAPGERTHRVPRMSVLCRTAFWCHLLERAPPERPAPCGKIEI